MTDKSRPSGEQLDEARRFLKSAIDFLANVRKARNTIRDKSKREYGPKLLDAHWLVTGVIYEMLSRKDLVPGKTSQSIANRRVLIASFLQGISICEEAITEGLYIQAAALVRQELETLAAIEEVVEGIREDQETPNVKHLPWKMNRLYGELSIATHVSEHGYLAQIYRSSAEGDARPVSVIPTYRRGAGRNLYAIHICVLVQIALHLHILQCEAYDSAESGLKGYEYSTLLAAVNNMEAEGVLNGIKSRESS